MVVVGALVGALVGRAIGWVAYQVAIRTGTLKPENLESLLKQYGLFNFFHIFNLLSGMPSSLMIHALHRGLL